MSVLGEILEWSADRPAWQRDALRRLVQQGELSVDDIGELASICKSAHGLAEPQDSSPLAREHVPEEAGAEPVSLLSIFHHRGVNALAEDQTLTSRRRLRWCTATTLPERRGISASSRALAEREARSRSSVTSSPAPRRHHSWCRSSTKLEPTLHPMNARARRG